MELQQEVIIQESPGGHWGVWADGERVDEGFFRRASDAQEWCNQIGYIVSAVLKHGEEMPS